MLTRITVYLLHAYDYYAEDPMICLSLAIACVGRAMQRQVDNRHHFVVQVRTVLLLFPPRSKSLLPISVPGVSLAIPEAEGRP